MYPRGFGRLVDKGFAFYTNVYCKHRNKGINPAFLTKGSIARSACGTKQLSAAEVQESAKQSKDRCVVETVFSRVKSEELLKGGVFWTSLKYVNAAYVVGCMTANMLNPLKAPVLST